MVGPRHGKGDELLQLPTAGPALGVGGLLRVSGGRAAGGGQVPGVAEQELAAVAPVFVGLAVGAQRLHPGGHPRVLAQVLRHLLRHVGPAGRGSRDRTLRRGWGLRGERPCHCGLHRRPTRERPSSSAKTKQQRREQLNRPLPPAAGSFPFITSLPPSARASFRREPALPGRFAAPEPPRRCGPCGGCMAGGARGGGRVPAAPPGRVASGFAPGAGAGPSVPSGLCDATRSGRLPPAPGPLLRGTAEDSGLLGGRAGQAESSRVARVPADSSRHPAARSGRLCPRTLVSSGAKVNKARLHFFLLCRKSNVDKRGILRPSGSRGI